MITQLVTAALSNACFALVLAIVAVVLGRKVNRPQLAHLLWLLVLAKLVTPPLVAIPIDAFWPSSESVSSTSASEEGVLQVPVESPPADSLLSHTSRARSWAAPWFATVWLMGSGGVLVWSLVRVLQFNRRLQAHTEAAPEEVVTAATDLAGRLQLRLVPGICTTTAKVSPMVWWAGGRVRVVVPSSLLRLLEPREWRWVLAHELAHVRRRDHVVRWLEWLARVVFWWNPMVWWAQRNLRALEEICCDDLVISRLKPEPRTYANSILTAIESLANPILRPPAMASGINSGGTLERRFRMMIENRVGRLASRRLQACVLIGAMVVLPLGVAYATDYEAVGERLRAAVEAKEITGEQARFMVGALRLTEGLGERKEKHITREDYAAAEAKMKAMVEAGEASEKDVRIRLGQMRRMMAGQGRERGGDLTVDWDAIKKRIEGAVERGDLARAEADAKYREIKVKSRKRMADRRGGEERRITREEYAKAEAKMRAMVEAGEASEEDVRIRLGQMRRMMNAGRDGGDERSRWEEIKQRIEGAVERGDLTREEADEKYAEMRRRMSRKDDAGGLDWKIIKQSIEGAVERGEMTREQAKATYRALKR